MANENIQIQITETGGKNVKTTLEGIAQAGAKVASGTSNLSSGLRDTGRAANEANTQLDTLEGTLKSLGSVGDLLKGTFAGIIAAFSIDKLIETSDAYTSMQNKLRNVTKDADEFRRVQEQLGEVAKNNFVPLEDTVDAYSRMRGALKELGQSSDETVNFVGQISKVISASGASANEGKTAFTQLAQGLSTGKVMFEDLKPVLESVPKLGQLIAQGLNVPVGKLKEMASQGQLTSKSLVDALKRVQPEIDKLELKPTIQQAFQRLSDSFTVMIGKFNEMTGASDTFARSIIGVADALPTIARIAAPALGAAAAWGTFRTAIAGVGTALGLLSRVAFNPTKLTTGLGDAKSLGQVVEAQRVANVLIAAQDNLGRLGSASPLSGQAETLGKVLKIWEDDTVSLTDKIGVGKVAIKGMSTELQNLSAREQVLIGLRNATIPVTATFNALWATIRANPFAIIAGSIGLVIGLIETLGQKTNVVFDGKTVTAASAFNQMMGQLWATIKTGVGEALASITGFGGTAEQVITQTIGAAIQWVIDHLDEIKFVAKAATFVIVGGFKIVSEAGKLVGAVLAEIIKAFIDVGGQVMSMAATVMRGWGIIIQGWMAIPTLISNGVNSIISTVGTIPNALITSWNTVVVFFETFFTMLAQKFPETAALIQNTWNGLVAVAGAIWGAISNTVANAARGLASYWFSAIETVKGYWTGFVSWLGNIVNQAIDAVVAKIRQWVGIQGTSNQEIRDSFAATGKAILGYLTGPIDAVKSAWDSLKTYVNGWIDWFRSKWTDAQNWFTGLWTTIANWVGQKINDAKSYVQPLIDAIGKIVDAWNAAMRVARSYNEIASGTYRPPGGNNTSARFASGGLVVGPGTGKSDSIDAKLSHGEFVVNAEATSKNLALLTRINGGASNDGGNHYATGGFVSPPTFGNGFTTVTLSPESINQLSSSVSNALNPAVTTISNGVQQMVASSNLVVSGNQVIGTGIDTVGQKLGGMSEQDRAKFFSDQDAQKRQEAQQSYAAKLQQDAQAQQKVLSDLRTSYDKNNADALKASQDYAATRIVKSVETSADGMTTIMRDMNGNINGVITIVGGLKDAFVNWGSDAIAAFSAANRAASDAQKDRNNAEWNSGGGFTDINGNPVRGGSGGGGGGGGGSGSFTQIIMPDLGDWIRIIGGARDKADPQILGMQEKVWSYLKYASLNPVMAGSSTFILDQMRKQVARYRDAIGPERAAKALGSIWQQVQGWATGGGFTVGGVGGSDDPNLVMFRANKGERVEIFRPENIQRGNDTSSSKRQMVKPNVTINITTPDVQSFRKSKNQILTKFAEDLFTAVEDF